MAVRKVVLIPGDGIGPEISEVVKSIFAALSVPIEWVHARAGLCVTAAGLGVTAEVKSGLPQQSLDLIKAHKVALKGPTTTPSGSGHQSINVLLRKKLGLFANVRPARNLPGVTTRFSGVNLVIVRENIEDTYGGIEYMHSPGVVQGLKLISLLGSERCIRFAFEYARANGRVRLVCGHKANIHKLADGMFLRVFNEIKEEYADITASDILIDNLCMQLVSAPERFEVLVMPNLYGDIVSDLCAGLVGGLGVLPSANIGRSIAVFEAVHGSAPDIAGKGIANPTALLLSSVMMLRYLSLDEHAGKVEGAVMAALEAGERTRDLGGNLSTKEFGDCIVKRSMEISGKYSEPSHNVRTVMPPEKVSLRGTAVNAETVGVDVVVMSATTPVAPLAVGSLSLFGIANRGVKTVEGDTLLEHVDVYCLRYLSETVVSDSDFREVLQAIAQAGLHWVQLQKLVRYNGVNGFTEMR